MDYIQHFLKTESLKQIAQENSQNKLIEGYLFCCDDLLTNEIFAKAVALCLVCENGGCMQCHNCLKALNVHPDILIFPEGKSFSVNDAKKIVQQVSVAPIFSNKKIFIINNIDISSEEAQNKILKILEEPPRNVYFLVTCTNLNNVLQTVKSRLQKRTIAPFSRSEIKAILNNCPDFALEQGNGYLGKTLDIMQDKNALTNYNLALSLITKLKLSHDVIFYSSKVQDKSVAIKILEMLSLFYQDILYIKVNKQNLVKNISVLSELKSCSNEFSVNAISLIQQLILESKKKLLSNVSYQFTIETMLVKILEVKFLCK